MSPFERLLQRVNAVGCAGFVVVVVIQILGWTSASRLPHEPLSVKSWSLMPSLTVSAASRDSGDELRTAAASQGMLADQWTERTPVNRLTLEPADAKPVVWPSEEDARLAAVHARYVALFREYRRRTEATTAEPVRGMSKGTLEPFSAVPQYAEVQNCGAQMSEVAELTQHR